MCVMPLDLIEGSLVQSKSAWRRIRPHIPNLLPTRLPRASKTRLPTPWSVSSAGTCGCCGRIAVGTAAVAAAVAVAVAAAAVAVAVASKCMTICSVFALHCLICFSSFLLFHVSFSASSAACRVSLTSPPPRACRAALLAAPSDWRPPFVSSQVHPQLHQCTASAERSPSVGQLGWLNPVST